MTDTTVSEVKSPVQDALTRVLKRGAQELLAKAVEVATARLLKRHFA